MAVYVDPEFGHGGSATFRWLRSCHMYADTLEELMEFATKRLRLRADWFQDKRVPHFDLTPNKRKQAVGMGAVEHTRQQAVDFWVEKGWHPKRLRDSEFEDDNGRETEVHSDPPAGGLFGS